MKISVQIIIDHENGAPTIVRPILELKREQLSSETLGITINESKLLLKTIQSEVVDQQTEHYISKNKTCHQCHKRLRFKGGSEIVYRTLFGKLHLKNPRYYKCSCLNKTNQQKSLSLLSSLFPERISPELQYIQTKYASLVSYGVTTNVLEDILPIHLNASSVHRITHKTAKRLDSEIEEDQCFYIKGCESDWHKLPSPESPITVGMDGGYIHARDGKNRKAGWFEAIVGKSLHDAKLSKRFGFVCKYDNKQKSRLNAMLQKQNFQMNQGITFLSDGGDTVRDLQYDISPCSEHLLDWFHITMRITVMRQMTIDLPGTSKEELHKELESIKWNLWHGNTAKALDKIDNFAIEFYSDKPDKKSKKYKLWKWVDEFNTYIQSNKHLITNYAERHRYGEVISSSFVESTVNEVISRRMVKKQQMRWTKEGAHRMIQVRTSTLNDELQDAFCRWYPKMEHKNIQTQNMRAA